jgi:hypothetical protein
MTMLASLRTTITYVPFDPPRRPEEYVGQPGPHNGLALEHNVLDAIGQARALNRSHPYVVRGEWRRSDGVTYLDIAVDRAWVTQNTNYRLIDGRLRWQCPVCGRLSGQHTKSCDFE